MLTAGLMPLSHFPTLTLKKVQTYNQELELWTVVLVIQSTMASTSGWEWFYLVNPYAFIFHIFCGSLVKERG